MIVKNKQIETIEREGLDLKILKKKSNAKTITGLILSKAQFCMKDKNFELARVYEELYKEAKDLEKYEQLQIEAWKGKSGIKLIENPDNFICITHQKADKGEEPKEIRKEILKTNLNDLIIVLNTFKEKDKIKTRDIAEKLYGIKWKDVFSDRKKHTELTLMFNILEQRNLIKYSRRGLTTIIKKLDYFLIK